MSTTQFTIYRINNMNTACRTFKNRESAKIYAQQRSYWVPDVFIVVDADHKVIAIYADATEQTDL